MRSLWWVCLAVLLGTGVAVAQNTPPGGDMVGSSRPQAQGGVRTSPAVTPDANQRITGTTGTSSGYENNPAYSGSSTYGTATAMQSPGKTGMSGQTAATAARRRAYRGQAATRHGKHRKPSAKQHKRKNSANPH